GLIDKPTRAPDHYHTCYCLSGLSTSQNHIVYEIEKEMESNKKQKEQINAGMRSLLWSEEIVDIVVLGDPDNLLKATHPIHNVSIPKVKEVKEVREESSPKLLITGTPLPTRTHEEYQYLDLIRRIIEFGEPREDRTGTGTYAIFAPPQLRFSLRDNIVPFLTTKRVFLRAVIEELLWFVKGSTDSRLLAEKDIHIWDGNGSREYLDKNGLSHRKQGQGVDQLQEVIDKIKFNPQDRRIILSAWNPSGNVRISHPAQV
ncbi:10816_t:CDS:2, partial [Acaulospora colombiana]